MKILGLMAAPKKQVIYAIFLFNVHSEHWFLLKNTDYKKIWCIYVFMFLGDTRM